MIARRHEFEFMFDSTLTTLLMMFAAEAEKEFPKKDERVLEPVEAVQAVAWMEMMYNDSGLTLEKANEAASIIQVLARNDSFLLLSFLTF